MSGLKFLIRTATCSSGFLRQQHVLATAAFPGFYRPNNVTKEKFIKYSDLGCSVDRNICGYAYIGRDNVNNFLGRLPRSSCSHNFGTKTSPDRAGKSESKSSPATPEADIFGETSKLGLVAKFKLMYKQYWYVLIPVHVVTSFSWLGAFYYMSKSGVDIAALMQYIHLSDSIIQKVHNSNMGHYAVAYLCYKIVTPVRYALTVGATTFLIKYLVQRGQLKPIPSRKELIRMYTQKKADRDAMVRKGEEEKKQS